MKSMIDRFDGDKVFFTSDTHFGHAGIITFCHRPFQDVAQMNETMIANWNRVVGPEDIVFHLGDFCLGGEFAFLAGRASGTGRLGRFC